jgi:hypothetical protein
VNAPSSPRPIRHLRRYREITGVFIMSRLDRLATRLALGILIAALLVSAALLTRFVTRGSPLQFSPALGLVVAAGLGVLLLISIMRGRG